MIANAETAGTGRVVQVQLRVCQYNLLSPTYATKWAEREGCVDHEVDAAERSSNWHARWPAVQRVIVAAEPDILTLQV